MRSLTLAAATAGLVLVPSSASAEAYVPPRLFAQCVGVAVVQSPSGTTIALEAHVVSVGGFATSIRCSVVSGSTVYGGVASAMPSPFQVVAGTATVPRGGTLQTCVTASAWFADGTTETAGPACAPVVLAPR